MQREFMPGDVVMLMPDTSSVAYVRGLDKWAERNLRISKIVYASERPKATGSKGVIYFELDGCVSDKGVPFGILREWVVPVAKTFRGDRRRVT